MKLIKTLSAAAVVSLFSINAQAALTNCVWETTFFYGGGTAMRHDEILRCDNSAGVRVTVAYRYQQANPSYSCQIAAASPYILTPGSKCFSYSILNP